MHKDDMIKALTEYERDGTLYRGVWELRIGDYEVMRIDARLSPQFEFNGHDSNWRSWKYSFMPEH